MARHLTECLKKHSAEAPAGKKGRKTRLLHLLAQAKYGAAYWLHLEASGTATLDDLDGFLRAIWLECCGHLSAFKIDGRQYTAGGDGGWEAEFGDLSIDVPLQDVLHVGTAFSYEYDFGSTTELVLKVLSEREGPADRKRPVRLLARNEPPAIPCGKCGEKPAELINREKSWDDSGWLCKACAKKDGVYGDESLPVVNSPRTGVCGYVGEEAESSW